MLVEIKRKPSTPQGTFGVWYIDNKQFCFTLERPATGGPPFIPEGTYECTRFNSPHVGMCWAVNNVPGRDLIRIHSANVYTELLGCIAPGKSIGELKGIPAVLDSKSAMLDLYIALGDRFTLKISSDVD